MWKEKALDAGRIDRDLDKKIILILTKTIVVEKVRVDTFKR